MIKAKTLRSWVKLLKDDEDVYIDEGGLTLYLDNDKEEVYLEVGGKPGEEEN